VAGDWRRLRNEELRNLYTLPYIIRVITLSRMRWAGHVTLMGEVRNAYNIVVGKPEWKRPCVSPRRRWEDNIKMCLRKIRWKVVDWTHLAQNRDQWRDVVNVVRNLRVS
jgi:hypothetical protein